MIARLDKWCLAAVTLGLAALLFPPVAGGGWIAVPGFLAAAAAVIALSGFFAWNGVSALRHSADLVLLVALGAVVSLDFVHSTSGIARASSGFWLFNLALWAIA